MPLDQTTISETTRVLLDAAAEVRKGWCQFALENNGAVCVRGGMMRATGIDPAGAVAWEWDALPVARAADERLAQYLGNTSDSNAAWNNAPGRTADEVIAALEAAAFMED